MPVDQRLQRTAFAQAIQTALAELCRTNEYPFIIPLVADAYQTSDGVHLTYAECVRYTRYLCENLRGRGILTTQQTHLSKRINPPKTP